jgi:CheY-like chemotaxis protein
MGYQVSTAGNGTEAATVSKQVTDPILGVLLDLSMPGPDGVATLTELRRQRPGIKAVLMSGYEEREALKPFHELGVDGFLQKPFSIEMMRKAVAVFSPEAEH